MSLARRIAALALVGAVWLAPTPAPAMKVYGAYVPETVGRIEKGRFRSRQPMDRTMRHFYSAYGRARGVVFQRMDAAPGVKGVHIANTRRGRTWDGINVYETRDGKVFIYVIPAKRSGK